MKTKISKCQQYLVTYNSWVLYSWNWYEYQTLRTQHKQPSVLKIDLVIVRHVNLVFTMSLRNFICTTANATVCDRMVVIINNVWRNQLINNCNDFKLKSFSIYPTNFKWNTVSVIRNKQENRKKLTFIKERV